MNNPQLTFRQRLFAPTSPFFKPLMYAGAIIAVLAGALSTFQDQILAAGLPVPGSVIIPIVGWVSAAVSAVSSLTVDFDKLDKLEHWSPLSFGTPLSVKFPKDYQPSR
ncbi:hypothetical protein [Siphonobacter sp. SORGH_AS_0500]|uniref:hypothetical protein n=1 Tax=Siphonobacter sp. SORGH_AS_0500 TaxID=1864824 RepID=UPI002863F627|nr:hypothetical protein [Siphonobacter sp. SORGH_AS_0500]MDR6195171.1 hypothetical protein [Siphonobacter sp. SORGH_AS_0500]